MPEPEPQISKLGEFLQRKAGPLPYWAWALAGAAVVGGVIWINGHGGLGALTGGNLGGGGGAGAGDIPAGGIPSIDIPGTTNVAPIGGGPAPSATIAPSEPVAGPVVGLSSPLLIGQQSGATGGIIAPIFGGGGGLNSYGGTWQGIIGTGGGINTTGRSSGTQIAPQALGRAPSSPAASGVVAVGNFFQRAVQRLVGGAQVIAAQPRQVQTPPAAAIVASGSFVQQAAQRLAAAAPRFSNPIPTSQTQVVQAPEPVNRRGGTQIV